MSRFDKDQAKVYSGKDSLASRRKLAHELIDSAEAWCLTVIYEDGSGDTTSTAPPEFLVPLIEEIDGASDRLIQGLNKLRDEMGG